MLKIYPPPHADDNAGAIDAAALAEMYMPQRPAAGQNYSLRANMVTSLDGRAAADGLSEGISSPADRDVFRVLRAHADCIVVGAQTAREENYRPARVDAAMQQQRRHRGQSLVPAIALVSRSLELDGLDELLDAVGTYVITCADSDQALRHQLAARTTVIEAGEGVVDLRLALRLLAQATGPSLLTEGGPGFLGQLLSLDLIDELCLTISPLIVGDDQLRVVRSQASALMSRFDPASVLLADGALITRYLRHRDVEVP